MTAAILDSKRPMENAATNRGFRMQRPTIPVVEELYRTGELHRRDGKRAPLDVFIPRLEGELLYSLVRYLAPAVTVEIGLANGISALFIAEALRNNGHGRHIAIDPFQSTHWYEAGLVALERARLREWVTLDPRYSHCALPDLEAQRVRAQFAFVDGSHQFDYVICDFLAIDRILEVGGLIAFDDSDWPAVSAVIRFALANRHYIVFDTGVVVEPPPVRPSIVARILRGLGRTLHPLGQRLRPDFLRPNHDLGIHGRCVVIQKLADDDRDSQSSTFVAF